MLWLLPLQENPGSGSVQLKKCQKDADEPKTIET